MFRVVRSLAALDVQWSDEQIAVHLGAALVDVRSAVAQGLLQQLLWIHRGQYGATEHARSVLREDCRQRQPRAQAWKIEARTGMREDGSQSTITNAAIPASSERPAFDPDEAVDEALRQAKENKNDKTND